MVEWCVCQVRSGYLTRLICKCPPQSEPIAVGIAVNDPDWIQERPSAPKHSIHYHGDMRQKQQRHCPLCHTLQIYLGTTAAPPARAKATVKVEDPLCGGHIHWQHVLMNEINSHASRVVVRFVRARSVCMLRGVMQCSVHTGHAREDGEGLHAGRHAWADIYLPGRICSFGALNN